MMKIKRKKILWIRLLVYSLAMGAGTFLVHQKWDEQARTTFKTALLQELQKRDTLSIPYKRYSLNSLYKQLDSYICFRGGKSRGGRDCIGFRQKKI